MEKHHLKKFTKIDDSRESDVAIVNTDNRIHFSMLNVFNKRAVKYLSMNVSGIGEIKGKLGAATVMSFRGFPDSDQTGIEVPKAKIEEVRAGRGRLM